MNIPLVDIIGQYIDLHPIASGYIGLCPFHEDNVPSFGINVNGNYWHCFAGCGGGEIISFWMKLNNCDFQTAVEELEMTLNKSAARKNTITPLHNIPVGRNNALSRRK